ncbi:thiamine-binding protein [Varibaculum prostatecancerukia]|uniref:thiamine-binding protein n=1 Tax=Varibaculum prostatecancerukia TaxID=2811781 RepID=UPI001C006AB5|nr:thiamine-binding protein [Varibaculum prostatecancerukia]
MLVAFSITPSTSDAEGGVRDAVAAAVKVIRDSGLPNRTDPMFTTIEGEWDECMQVVKDACEAVSRFAPRVALILKADIRPGRSGEMTAKLTRLDAALEKIEP